MKNLLYAIILLAMCSLAKADVYHLTINSAEYNDGHSNLGPYHSTLQIGDHLSVPLLTYCIDFTSQVGFGQSFGVSVVNLHDFSGALHQNYWEAGWLALQLSNTTDLATRSDINRAIWLITTPGTSDPYLTTIGSFTWATAAAQNYTSVSDSMFVLYLKNGEAGQSQLSVVPEPGTFCWILIGASLLVFLYLGRKQRRAK